MPAGGQNVITKVLDRAARVLRLAGGQRRKGRDLNVIEIGQRFVGAVDG